MSLLATGSMADLLTNGRFDFPRAESNGALYLLKRLKIRETKRTYRDGSVEETVVYDVTLRDKIGALHDLGTHHDLWNPEIKDPDAVLASILGYPKGLLPTKLDKPDAIEAQAVEVSNKSEERCLTLAGKSTELPAKMALDTNKEAQHALEERPESELPQPDMSESKKGREGAEELNTLNQQLTNGRRLERQVSATYEPTPQEFPVSNQLTPSKVELDEKASVGNTLKRYRKLNSKKPDSL